MRLNPMKDVTDPKGWPHTINGKDTEKQTNERANEWKIERKNTAEIHEWNIE